MIPKVLISVLLLLLGYAFWTLSVGYAPDTELNRTAAYYAANAESEVGAPNIVTGIIVTWRGLDTLGEVTVLFLTSAIIALVLSQSGGPSGVSGADFLPSGELLTTGARMLVPLIVLFGAYVIMNGHLTPGGGFQGGAILASGVLMALLAEPTRRFGHTAILRIESLSGSFYVLIGLAGMAIAGGFLDNGILPLGQFGTMLSAGAIPLISVLIGLKVGAEFSSILQSLHETEDA
ncbi:hydrogen gas-evolving membrane-bound hydrogenase subunit E [Tropicimonas sediminicola]|uniref:Multicomponent Na+:H+ antiporter subunit B n=1 Tax=Tropicimonas sediminicola TaxID=1031541 RepID=A0A239LKA0_9RHOB|nr:hydrogen gas-evolving membrane-bound hydrogenase subunit E [Tropicimonas sediminicola]SNT30014.1 multicomponent Na+:H+ antiporter subunit B [Tropicimonas sediminicola]